MSRAGSAASSTSSAASASGLPAGTVNPAPRSRRLVGDELAGRRDDREAGSQRVDEARAERVARLDAAGIERHRRIGAGEPRAALVVRDPVDDLDRVLDAELRARARPPEPAAREAGTSGSGLRAPHSSAVTFAPLGARLRDGLDEADGVEPVPEPAGPDEVEQPGRRRCAAPDRRPAVGPNGTVRKSPSSAGSSIDQARQQRAAREHHPERQVALARVRAEHEVGRGQQPREHGRLVGQHPPASLGRPRSGARRGSRAGRARPRRRPGAGRRRAPGSARAGSPEMTHRRAALDEAADVVQRDEAAAFGRARPRGRDEHHLETVRGERRGRGRRRAARGRRGCRCRPRRCRRRPSCSGSRLRPPRHRRGAGARAGRSRAACRLLRSLDWLGWRSSSRWARRAVWLIAIAAVLRALVWVVALPPWQGPDEGAHYSYVERIAVEHSIPPLDRSGHDSFSDAVAQSTASTGYIAGLTRQRLRLAPARHGDLPDRAARTSRDTAAARC